MWTERTLMDQQDSNRDVDYDDTMPINLLRELMKETKSVKKIKQKIYEYLGEH
jgi:hypothetical protein